jgi:hypothetical protein
VRKAIECGGTKVLALPGCFSTAFRGEGACPLNRNSRQGSGRIDGSIIGRMAADDQRADRSRA